MEDWYFLTKLKYFTSLERVWLLSIFALGICCVFYIIVIHDEDQILMLILYSLYIFASNIYCNRYREHPRKIRPILDILQFLVMVTIKGHDFHIFYVGYYSEYFELLFPTTQSLEMQHVTDEMSKFFFIFLPKLQFSKQVLSDNSGEEMLV